MREFFAENQIITLSLSITYISENWEVRKRDDFFAYELIKHHSDTINEFYAQFYP